MSFCKSVLIEVDLQNTTELKTPLLSQYSDSRCSRNLQIGLSFLGALGFIHFLLSVAILCVLVKKKSIDRNLNMTKISINILHLLQSAVLVPMLVYFTIELSNDRTLANSTLLTNDSSMSFREKAFDSWWSIGNILAFGSIFVLISKLWVYSFLSLDRILIIKNPLSARSKTRVLRIKACLCFSYFMAASVAVFVSFFLLFSYLKKNQPWFDEKSNYNLVSGLIIAGLGEKIALIYLITIFLPFVFIIVTNCCLPFMFASHRRSSNLRSSRDNDSVEYELAKTTIIEVF